MIINLASAQPAISSHVSVVTGTSLLPNTNLNQTLISKDKGKQKQERKIT
jgi:hypothetical protein